MKTAPLSELVLDFTLYPRRDVDAVHVHYLRQAIRAGAILPPLIICRKTRRLVDGFHRYKAYLAEKIKAVEVIEKHYPDEKAAFLDAIRLNAGHGRRLDSCDRAHCLLRAEDLGIQPEQVASALSLTVEALGELRAERVGQLRSTGGTLGMGIPLKNTIRHMAGRTLTKAQAEANKHLGGNNALFYINQVILLVENDLLDFESERVAERIERLAALLAERLKVVDKDA